MTLLRYESRLQKCITTVGDCPITQVTSDNLSLYKRRLLDESLALATMVARLSGFEIRHYSFCIVPQYIPSMKELQPDLRHG